MYRHYLGNGDVDGARSFDVHQQFRNNQTGLKGNKYTVKGMFEYTENQLSSKGSAIVGLAFE